MDLRRYYLTTWFKPALRISLLTKQVGVNWYYMNIDKPYGVLVGSNATLLDQDKIVKLDMFKGKTLGEIYTYPITKEDALYILHNCKLDCHPRERMLRTHPCG